MLGICCLCTNRTQNHRNVSFADRILCESCAVECHRLLFPGGIDDELRRAWSAFQEAHRKWCNATKMFHDLKDGLSTEHVADLRKQHADLCRQVATQRALFTKAENKNKQLRRANRILLNLNAIEFEKVHQKAGGFVYHGRTMPSIPEPFLEAGAEQIEAVINRSGIYFVWNDARVVYVGQSINLSGRLCGSHENIRHGDRLSWIFVPRERLTDFEHFYIWLCLPERNYGGRFKNLSLEDLPLVQNGA